MRLPLVLHCFFVFSPSLAIPFPPSPSSTLVTAAVPNPTACGDIIRNSTSTGPDGQAQYLFNASVAYECLQSVPFNAAVATRLIKYLNDTYQFQSTLAYLKNPPSSYQQPAVDLIQGFNAIQAQIDANVFQNEYAFEAALQNLLYSAHDTHVNLVAGALAVFTFGSGWRLSSISTNGVQLPKVYLTDDFLLAQSTGNAYKASAVTKVNGVHVTDYLSQFAAVNAIGGIEPHSDWNQLMSSPALEIQGIYSIFEGFTTFYPGDTLTFTFENDTTMGPMPWYAIYNSVGPTGPLTTGGDFYNFFVLGLYPASFYEQQSAQAGSGSGSTAAATTTTPASSTTAVTVSAWPHPAYPTNPVVSSTGLGTTGSLTGYFLPNSKIGVLSIPSFSAYGQDAVADFSDQVYSFIQASTLAGMTKIVIDLQRNGGGDRLLAVDTYKQFFPPAAFDPFVGGRLRAQPMADAIGTAFTNYWDSLSTTDDIYYFLADSVWVATDYLDAEISPNRNFTSWAELYGPHLEKGDYFTTVQRDNLDSFIFDVEASGGIVVYGYANQVDPSPPAYSADDIIILSDGQCASACALFMEMMHYQAGVRTVVAGGRPSYGPMQAPGGTRGDLAYTNFELDYDMASAVAFDAAAGPLLPDRTEDFRITYASFNIRDQMRPGESTPLQFVYDGADCRIFYTPDTFWNLANLWRYAADAIWSRPEYCVQGSTGYASTSTSPPASPPLKGSPVPGVSSDMSGVISLSGVTDEYNASAGNEQVDSRLAVLPRQAGTACTGPGTCRNPSLTCETIDVCEAGGNPTSEQRCMSLSNSDYGCPGGYTFRAFPTQCYVSFQGHKRCAGYCQPPEAQCGTPTAKAVATHGPSPGGGSGQTASSGRTKDDWLGGGKLSDFVAAGIAAWM